VAETPSTTQPPLAPAPLLWGATAAVSLLGLGAELLYIFGEGTPLQRKLVPFFSLSDEANLPTWYAASLLLCASLLLSAIARMPRPDETSPRHWRGLAAIFLYMSLDESVQLHEQLSQYFHTSGVLYYGWVIPAAAFVLLVLVTYLSFLRKLSPYFRWGFVAAGALYVGGALLMELPLGAWAEIHGDDNPTYAMLDWVEETLELAGASLFIIFLHRYWISGGHGDESHTPG